MFCLDTNIIIDIFRGDETLRLKINKLFEDSVVYVSPLVICELYKGAFKATQQKEALQLVEDFIDSVEILEFSRESCKWFGKEWVSLRKMGKITQEIDLMIASMAIAHDLILVTRNKKDFENIPNLKLEVW